MVSNNAHTIRSCLMEGSNIISHVDSARQAVEYWCWKSRRFDSNRMHWTKRHDYLTNGFQRVWPFLTLKSPVTTILSMTANPDWPLLFDSVASIIPDQTFATQSVFIRMTSRTEYDRASVYYTRMNQQGQIGECSRSVSRIVTAAIPEE